MPAPDGKIRIAYLIDTINSDKAGTEKQLLQLIERIDRDRFLPAVVCLYRSPFMSRLHQPCETLSLGYRGFLRPSIILVIYRYLRLLKERRFDLVQTFFEDAMFLGVFGQLLSGGGQALVVSRRDLGLGADEPGYHRLFKRLHRFVFGVADGVAVNAEALAARLVASGVTPGKVRLIRNGMSIPAAPAQRPPIFAEHPHEVWVVMVANLKPIKRVDLFLDAFALAAARFPRGSVGGIVLGEGRLRPELEGRIAALGLQGTVHLAGAVENVSDYLHFCDIGVLCSDNEGLSNALMECMGCGLPVAVTEVGGNTELVDETNGFVVPAGDPEALAAALCALTGDPALRTRLGAAAKARVEAETGWETVMPQWETYYRQIVEGCDHV